MKIICKFIYVYLISIFYMEKFDSVMLSAIIITLFISSTQTIIADDKPNVKTHTLDPDINLRYEVYLQTTIRDAQGQLLSVSESIIGWVTITTFPDGKSMPDLVEQVFNHNILDEKEVVTIDNVKYEKIQFFNELVVDHNKLLNLNPTTSLYTNEIIGTSSGGWYNICMDFKEIGYGHLCGPFVAAKMPLIHLAEDYILTDQWTILRVIN